MKRKKDCPSCQHCTKLNGAQYSKDKIWWLCDLHDLRVDYPDRYKCANWKARPYNRDIFIWVGE